MFNFPAMGTSSSDTDVREAQLAVREAAMAARERALENRERLHEDADAREAKLAAREASVAALENGALRPTEQFRVSQSAELTRLRNANECLVLEGVRADERDDHAREVAQQKENYVAMVGHELRGPLAPILSTLELMAAREPLLFDVERGLIARQVSNLVRLVEDLLDIARIGAGKLELRRERVNLAEVVKAALDIAAPVVRSKSHELTVEVASDLQVDADPLRLGQAVANLIANAAKYTPKYGHIRVKCERRGENAAVTVHDNGIGISADKLPRVFDLFYQESTALGQSQGGLGLGLAIVHELASLHGGVVSATSPGPGQGSTFELVIPAA